MRGDRARLRWIRKAAGRYERHLAGLRTDRIPASRAETLDLMALIASGISAAERRDRECEQWYATAELLRAVAASERGFVLTCRYSYVYDVTDDGEDIPCVLTDEWRHVWKDLAAQLATGDRGKRAELLSYLAGEAAGAPGILVLDDIAETELVLAAAAGPPPAALEDTRVYRLGLTRHGDGDWSLYRDGELVISLVIPADTGDASPAVACAWASMQLGGGVEWLNATTCPDTESGYWVAAPETVTS